MNTTAQAFITDTIVIVIGISSLLVLFQRRVRNSTVWSATITPLASIIGSGFLICAPLLVLAAGKWAILVMSLILIVAFGLGNSMRFNIRHVEDNANSAAHPYIQKLELFSRPILGIAYLISVAFYLKLLSVFIVHWLEPGHIYLTNILTTALILFIGLSGKFKGLKLLEKQEIYAVNLKLAIILGFLGALLFYNTQNFSQLFSLTFENQTTTFGTAIQKILGTLIIIQGFETSRYLGSEYQGTLRIKTMRLAQIIAAIIYFLFITLSMPLLTHIHQVNETLIIDLSKHVAIILPFMITVAAVLSQFSAAIADTLGSGGLISEAFDKKISEKNCYLIVMSGVIILTWLTNVFDIVVIASKAFATYYALQLIISMVTTWKANKLKLRFVIYTLLLILMILVVLFGIPVE